MKSTTSIKEFHVIQGRKGRLENDSISLTSWVAYETASLDTLDIWFSLLVDVGYQPGSSRSSGIEVFDMAHLQSRLLQLFELLKHCSLVILLWNDEQGDSADFRH